MTTDAIAIVRRAIASSARPYNELPAATIRRLWEFYSDNYGLNNNNINGKVFEEIIGYTFFINSCCPFYMQASVVYVPNVNYDFIFYDAAKGPLSVSAKTSLRERWKQADLEAVALKYVHRNAQSYVVSMNEAEVSTRRQKLNECMAINDFYLATSKHFNDLINTIKERNLSIAGKVDVITAPHIVSNDMARTRYDV